MVVLVIPKYEEDLIKNEVARVATTITKTRPCNIHRFLSCKN